MSVHDFPRSRYIDYQMPGRAPDNESLATS
jgi:hypothetical protein